MTDYTGNVTDPINTLKFLKYTRNTIFLNCNYNPWEKDTMNKNMTHEAIYLQNQATDK
jgi:hypothetical protein